MTAPQYRSRSKKRKNVRVPGGKTVMHYKAKKPSQHVCGRCKKILTGVPNAVPSELAKLSKTEKVPERPYGGALCTECTERLFRYKTRFEVKYKYPEFSELEIKRDLTLERYLPTTWWENITKEE